MYWTGDSIVPVIDTPYGGGGVPDVPKGREEGGIAPPWARVMGFDSFTPADLREVELDRLVSRWRKQQCQVR